MTGMTESYDIAIMDETYRVMHEEDEGTIRICIYSDGQLRFSLPDNTPREEVEKFIRVYALGVSDGKLAGANLAAGQIQWQLDPIPSQPSASSPLQHALQRLGQAISKTGNWKTGAK
jgi:hypothetical protein